jgi:hypothetical protein
MGVACRTLAKYIFIFILLFTAIMLLPGGSSPTLVQTKIKIHKTSITTKQLQNNKYKYTNRTGAWVSG